VIIVGHIRKPFATQLTLKTLEEMKYVTFSVKNRKASHNTSTHNNTKGKNVLTGRKEKKMQKGGPNRLALPTTADLPPGAVFGFSKCTAGRDNSWSYKYFRGENQQTNKIC
jgi:hypothetical protein